MRRLILALLLVLVAWPAWGATTRTQYYVDNAAADDTGTGLVGSPKKTPWGCLTQIAEDFADATDRVATINITPGTYSLANNIVFSSGAIYGGSGYGLKTVGTSAMPWIIQGVGGTAIIQHEATTTYTSYNAALGSNKDYVQINHLQFQNGTTTKDDVYFSNAENWLIEYCRFFPLDHAVYSKDSEGGVFRYNYIKGQLASGSSSAVKFENDGVTADNGQAYYNVIETPGGTGTSYHFGIEFVDASGGKIYNNTIYAANRIAIGFYGTVGSPNGVVKNNIVTGSTPYDIFVDAVSALGFTSDYNIWYTTGTPFYWGGGWVDIATGPSKGTAYSFADWKTATSTDAASLNVDPLLTSATVFYPLITSPAIHSGMDSSAISTTDKDGYPAADGGLYNPGAFSVWAKKKIL